MNKITFRQLRADEVDVRPAEVKNDKVTLLLYQNARCAQNILDESVGCLNWQKEYYPVNGLTFCKIGIKDSETNNWVWKSDTGSESNIEADKGLASDAFKRAAVSWGIGRELYTAPRISISLTDKDLYGGKLSQKFSVGNMTVSDGEITALTIVDKWGNMRFSYPSNATTTSVTSQRTECHTDISSDVKAELCYKTSRHPNEVVLEEFYNKKKAEGTVDAYQLEKFHDHYLQPDMKDNSKSIIATWKHLDIDKLWTYWMNKSYKR